MAQTEASSRRILRFLGEPPGRANRALTDLEVVQAVRDGLPARAFRSASEALDMPGTELARALGLSRRTLARRSARLSRSESSRLFRLARIHTRAAEVLDGAEAATRWLRRPHRALGGEVPLALLDTDAGALAVERLLGRIEDTVVT